MSSLISAANWVRRMSSYITFAFAERPISDQYERVSPEPNQDLGLGFRLRRRVYSIDILNYSLFADVVWSLVGGLKEWWQIVRTQVEELRFRGWRLQL